MRGLLRANRVRSILFALVILMFRMTHRLARDLKRGDFGDLAADLFGLDNGAIIGLEYRFAIADTLQAGIHRSIPSKTIRTFARWASTSAEILNAG